MADHFEWEAGWEVKAFHFRSSLNPLGNAVREETDKIAARVKAAAQHELGRFSGTREDAKAISKKNRSERLRYFRNKAMAYSLQKYVETVRPIMVQAGDENYGAVVAYHAAADRIEFGGKDDKIELGKTGERLDYPAFAFMRRGLAGSG